MSNPLTWTPECQSLTRSGWAESKERTLVYGTDQEAKQFARASYGEFRASICRIPTPSAKTNPPIWDTPEVREDLSKGIYHQFRVLVNAYDPARGIPIKPYLVRQLTATIYNYARRGWIENGNPRHHLLLTSFSCHQLTNWRRSFQRQSPSFPPGSERSGPSVL